MIENMVENSRFTYKHNPNIIIRTGTISFGGRYPDKHVLLVTSNDVVIEKKIWSDPKRISNWLAEKDRINKMSIKQLQAETKLAKLNLPAQKRHGSILYNKGILSYPNGWKSNLHILVGPIRADGTRRLHSYSGNVVNNRFCHDREPSAMAFALTEKEALHMVKVGLDNYHKFISKRMVLGSGRF